MGGSQYGVLPEALYPYARLATTFDLGIAEGNDIETLNAGLLYSDQPLQDTPTLTVSEYPVVSRRQHVCSMTPEGGEGTSHGDPAPPNVNDVLFEELAETYAVTQLDHPNLEAAVNQCNPMSFANGLKFLENTTGLSLPHDHGIGLRGDETLVGQISESMERDVVARRLGSPVGVEPGIEGRLDYIARNNLQGFIETRHWGTADDIGDRDVQVNVLGRTATSSKQGTLIDFDAVLAAMANGESCEAGFFWPGGGHVATLIDGGFTDGMPWIVTASDQDQYFDFLGANANGFSFSHLIDTDLDDDFNLNGTDQELQMVICQRNVAPALDEFLVIRANGELGGLTVEPDNSLATSLEIRSIDQLPSGEHEIYIVMQTADGQLYYFDLATFGFLPGLVPTLVSPLPPVANTPNFAQLGGLPPGTVNFYFAIDPVINGFVDLEVATYTLVSTTIPDDVDGDGVPDNRDKCIVAAQQSFTGDGRLISAENLPSDVTGCLSFAANDLWNANCNEVGGCTSKEDGSVEVINGNLTSNDDNIGFDCTEEDSFCQGFSDGGASCVGDCEYQVYSYSGFCIDGSIQYYPGAINFGSECVTKNLDEVIPCPDDQECSILFRGLEKNSRRLDRNDLIIQKRIEGAGEGEFVFSDDGTAGPSSAKLRAGNGNPKSFKYEFYNRPLKVSENPTSGWELVDIECDPIPLNVDLKLRLIEVEYVPNTAEQQQERQVNTTICTFVNRQYGDSDADGATDDVEDCPETPAGTLEVDDRGCADRETSVDGLAEFWCNYICSAFASGNATCDNCAGFIANYSFVAFGEANGFIAYQSGTMTLRGQGSVSFQGKPVAACGSDPACKISLFENTLECESDPGPEGCSIAKPDQEPEICPTLFDSCIQIIERDGTSSRDYKVVVKKEVENGADGEFQFISPTLDDASRTIQTTQGTWCCIVYLLDEDDFRGFIVGEFSIPKGFVATDVQCVHPDQSPVSYTKDQFINIVATIDDNGPTVVCTFINLKTATEDVQGVLVTVPEETNPGDCCGSSNSNLSLPDGAIALELTNPSIITIAGSNGLYFVDAKDDTIPTAGNTLLSFIDVGVTDLYGALVVDNPFVADADAIFAFGANGTATRTFDPDTGFFGGWALSFPPRNVTDANVFEDDSGTVGVISTDFTNNEVRLNTWVDFGGGSYFFNGLAPSVRSFALAGASGNVISANTFGIKINTDGTLAMDNTGRILLATDGQPGELYVANPATPFDPASKVGDLGSDPRRIECLESRNLCAVSNNGSDSLTIVQWDGGDSPTIVGTVAVDEEPIGIDLREDGDNIKVLSTSMVNDTFTVVTLDSDGNPLNTLTEAAPEGCTGPAYGLWLENEENAAVITCSTSDAYAVIEPQ